MSAIRMDVDVDIPLHRSKCIDYDYGNRLNGRCCRQDSLITKLGSIEKTDVNLIDAN